MDLTASDKAFEEAAERVILKNPNGFGFKTEGNEVASKLSSFIAGKSGMLFQVYGGTGS
jgi:hypothetical protein